MSRKLDAALAKALGESVEWVGGDPIFRYEKYSAWWTGPVPRYSTDGNDMLRLEGEMRERGYGVSISRHGEGGWKACWWKGTDPFGMCEADTMPEAVALSAYRALTGKEWVE